MKIKSTVLKVFDNILDEISVQICDPFLPGYIKDFLTIFIKEKIDKKKFNKYLSNKSKMDEKNFIDFNFDRKLFIREGVIKFNLEEIANQFRPYIKKYNNYEKSKNEIYNKSYFYNILRREICSQTFYDFLSFGFNNKLNDFLTKKFGEVVFCGGGIYKSPPTTSFKGSQIWHIDKFSINHFKLFINLDDINENIGPTKVLSKTTTKDLLRYSFLRKLFRKKVSNFAKAGLNIDSKDLGNAISKKCTSNVGNIGTALLAQTGQCLHLGSNNRSKKNRYVLIFHYSKNSRYRENLTNNLNTGIYPRYLNEI